MPRARSPVPLVRVEFHIPQPTALALDRAIASGYPFQRRPIVGDRSLLIQRLLNDWLRTLPPQLKTRDTLTAEQL